MSDYRGYYDHRGNRRERTYRNNFSGGYRSRPDFGVSEETESHSRNKCPLFRQLKSGITRSPYVDVKLRDCDENGFAAAGFLLWKRTEDNIEVLMAREFRDGLDNLNFLGGKRRQRQESSIDVALKKVDMESGRKLLRSTLNKMKQPPLVHWSGTASKYVLYLFEVTTWNDCEIDVMCAGIYNEGIKRLEWIKWEDLKSERFKRDELHDFTIQMVEDLSHPSCNVLGRIKELFDTAEAASKKSSEVCEEKTVFSFDVVQALMSSAETARGNHQKVGKTLCWGDISDAVNALHRKDIMKLQRRFHPDRLKNQLQRNPTEIEGKAATKAMQVLNQILDAIKGESKAPS
ncbi:uncharacterized protein LOC130635176 [Hydractinia symbiolongicarpus]|uniref:uncharacterized protein LOC130635176 n=1 Tax=Hydractinia symbiolongicarpus TaxID=13093 RepID=UPI002549DE19|nr:uncharacterized protein LOC130635176 [Hydractinia symbiolongicarpus]